MSAFRNNYKIKYLNNIFLKKENYQENLKKINDLEDDISFLILNGNIGNPLESEYTDFLKMCCKKVKFIIIVLGDYEYSFYNYNIINNRVRNIVDELYLEYNNIVFLENGYLSYLDKIFIGSSLYNNDNYVKDVKYILDKVSYSISRYKEPFIITFNPINESIKYRKIDRFSKFENNILYI